MGRGEVIKGRCCFASTLLRCFPTLAKGRNHLMTAAEIPLREKFTIHPIKKKNKNYSYETVGSMKTSD